MLDKLLLFPKLQTPFGKFQHITLCGATNLNMGSVVPHHTVPFCTLLKWQCFYNRLKAVVEEKSSSATAF